MRRLPAAVLALVFAAPAAADSFADAATLEVAFEPPRAKRGEAVTLVVTIKPKPGAYTYPLTRSEQGGNSRFQFGPAGDVVLVGDVPNPPGAERKETAPGQWAEVYTRQVTWRLPAVVSPAADPGRKTIKLEGTRFQACTTGALAACYFRKPPGVELEVLDGLPAAVPEAYRAEVERALAPPPAAAPVAPAAPPAAMAAPTGVGKKAPLPPAEYAAALDELAGRLVRPDAPAGGPAAGGLAALLAAAAFWGLVSLVTPCVFPMIPITVSLFLKQSHNAPGRVLQLAAVYCLTIIAVIGVSAAFLLSVFRELSTDWRMNVFLGGLFVAFALSLFGMYDIALPGSLLRGAERRRGAGGLVGTVFGALAFSVVSFTCVAPFLGGFAGLAASGSYSRAELILAGLTFAAAFAAPFFVLALFPSLLKALPRSGGWLDTVKVVMGFLELAAAFKFFRTAELRLADRPEFFTYDVVLSAWVAIAAAAGLYLLNVYRLPHDEETGAVGVGRLMLGLGFLGLGVYLTPALFKPATPGAAGPRPGGVVYAWVDAFLLPDPGDDLPWGADLSAAVAAARQHKGRVFVDFTGVTCTNCRYNEHAVFPRPGVRQLLGRYTLTQLYTDEVPGAFYTAPPADADRAAEAAANLAFQRKAFGDERLPLYAVLEPLADGKVRVVGVYDEGKINNPAGFAEFLRAGLEGE